MKRWILAVALFLGCSGGYASADYVILMVNLSGASQGGAGVLGGGNIGVPGGAMGMGGMRPGGAMGMPGGAMGVAGGAVGMVGVPPGGAAGIGGIRPPGGAVGIPPGGALGAGGIPPGGAAGVPPAGGPGFPGGPGSAPPPGAFAGMAGAAGGPQGGMMGASGGFRPPMGAMGMPGGAMGMPGGALGAGGGGFLGALAGMGGLGRTEMDDNARFIVAVVEVRPEGSGDHIKKLERSLDPVLFTHKWGRVHLRQLTLGNLISRTVLLKDGSGKPLAAVPTRYAAQAAEVFANPSPDKLLDLARWCLEHGLVDKFAEVMDKLVALDKNLPAADAYAKVKAALKQPPEKNNSAGDWRAKLMEGYKIAEKEGYHYALLYSSTAVSAADQEDVLKTLENTFLGFYYWWAFHGVVLPVPHDRQLAVVTDKADELHRFRHILTSGPLVGDGFFARREGLTVLSARRLDEPYDALDKYSSQWWSKGYVREAIVTGQKGAGHPKLAPPNEIWDAELLALLLKVMETESLRTTVSHDASRQLLYSAGLLPRNVSAPEWFLFGMGSFFETSPQSPWATIGATSFYWQPLFKEMKQENKLGKPYDVLRMVVTDGYFRVPVANGEALRKARTTSWALTYFLAQTRLKELQQYCKELGKLPRDLELDESTLLEAFARAMRAVDAANKPDPNKLASLANEWFNYMNNTSLEAENLRKQIKDYYKDGQQMIERPGNAGGNPAAPGIPGVRPPGN